MNVTSGYIWAKCDGKASIEEIGDLVVKHFDVDPAVARDDVRSAVAKLRKLGLLASAEGKI